LTVETVALTVAEAEAFLKAHARHYTMPAEPIAAIGLAEGSTLHGAAILGRLDGECAALAHIYVDGAWGGYSHLYGACWRALKALGYKKVML
jgi:hypothetical protein